jgi:succinate dehydrogenase / fumarate reductase cytochrome b subunit
LDLPHLIPTFGRREFALRRLHSLLGVMPLGGYLVFHLATNASVIDGLETYQRRSEQIHALGNLTVQVLGWGVILLPILIHAILGLVIVSRGHRNLLSYPYRENFRYTLERFTAVLVFIFVIWHVFHMQGWFQFEWWTKHVAWPLGGARFKPEQVESAVQSITGSPWITTIYIVGTLAAVYHLANGLWTAGITWGLWTSANAQRWANVPCLLFGIGMAVMGMGVLWGMYRADLPAPQQATMGLGMIAVGLLLPRWGLLLQSPLSCCARAHRRGAWGEGARRKY